MAGRETLFNAVKNLQAERQLRNKEMMDFMGSLSDTGKIGFAIGSGLSRLFGGSEDPKMLQAQREDAYAKQYMMEQDPTKRAAMRQGAYALSTELGQKIDAVDAEIASAQTKALKTQLEIENIRSQIRERDKPDTTKHKEIKGLNKNLIKQYENLLEKDKELATRLEQVAPDWKFSDFLPDILGGTQPPEVAQEDARYLIIDAANKNRQKYGLDFKQSLNLALSEYQGMQPTAPQPTAPSTAPQAPTLPSLRDVGGVK